MDRKGFSIAVLLVVVGLLVAGGGAAIYLHWPSEVTTTPPLKLTVGGSGSAGFALERWTAYYENEHPNVQFEFLPSTDTAVGIRGVGERTLDIGVSSRAPKPEEEFPGMVMTHFARDAVVFAVNKSVANVHDLTGQQLKGIYTGAITDWREVGGGEARIIPIDREEAESSKKLLRTLFLQQEEVMAHVAEVHSEKDVLAAVVSTPNSIGYLSYGRAKTADVTVLSFNGIGVEEGMRSAAYPMARNYWVVTRDDSPAAVKDFVAFLEGEGRDLIGPFLFFK